MGDEWLRATTPGVEHGQLLRDLAKAYEQAQAGGTPPASLPRWVAESWNQSRAQGVNPNSSGCPVLSQAELQRRLQESRLAPAWNTLWTGLEGVASGERMVEVTDGDGYVLLRKGDNNSKIRRLANEVGFVVGARMDMGAMGTSGIAVALERRVPVQIPGPCHWRRNQHGVNCTAVPVLDLRRKNRPLAVINVTGLGPFGHPDTLRLVRVVASNVRRELATAHSKKVERLCADAGSLDRVTGWALVTDRDGWVATSHRMPTPPDRVALPEGRHTQPGQRPLPDFGRCVLEPLPGGWLIRHEVPGEDDPVIRTVLDLRHPRQWGITVTGPNVRWQHQLTLRQAEILLLLATAQPNGRTGAELAEDLYGAPKTSALRTDICRLREYTGGLLDHRPYRFSTTVRVAVQRPATRTRLLPDSTAPGVIRLRR